MAKKENRWSIRRILVALDASQDSIAALEAAVNLAAEMEAELVGVFVEDVNLLRLASLPFTREMRYLSNVEEELSQQRMEEELRAQAARARRALLAAAEEAHIRASFRVVRGQVALELLTAASEADFLMLGRVSRPLTRRVRMGSTARAAVIKAERPVLLMQRTTTPDYAIMVTYDGSELSQRARETAVSLARENTEITFLLLTDSRQEAEQLRQETAVWLEQRGLSAQFRWLPQTDIESLTAAVQTGPCRLLVLGGENITLDEQALQTLLDDIDCSLMLVR